MTGAPVPPMRARQAPTPTRGLGRWLASEWGLALLALVLAVLVWAIVWNRISFRTDEAIKVKLVLRTSDGFVAFHQAGEDWRAPLTLKGPRAEIEEAITKMGQPPTLLVSVPDLVGTEDNALWWIRDTSSVSIPFPSRLVEDIGETAVDVYRIREVQARFMKPAVEGIPKGVGYSIELNPESVPISGPAGKIGSEIQPNPIDVSDLFADHEGGLLPDAVTRPLGFGEWRNDPIEQRYRKSVELPTVRATIRFHFTGTREIRHRIEFKHPEGFLVTTKDPEVELGYYRGRFEGAEDDLEALERSPGSWWYVVTIPEDMLPADAGEEPTADLKVEFAHKQAIHDLRVKFIEGASLLVVIRRAP